MKKYEVFSCCLFFLFEFGVTAQENIITGEVVDAISNTPVENVKIQQGDTGEAVYSDAKGRYQISIDPTQKRVLFFSLSGYETKKMELLPSTIAQKYLGSIQLMEKKAVFSVANVIDLSDDDLLDNDIGGANIVTGLLESSKDVFTRTAAFNFGQARFKVRGYDNREGTVLFNGVKMNKIQNGRPQWSNWGGLNDVLRNFSHSYGIAASEDGFGGVLGQTNFITNASEYRKGTSFSLAASNSSYRSRLMLTHASGLLKNNWAFTISASTRMAREGLVSGTSYQAFSGFFAAEKKFNAHNRLNFTLVYAFNERGRSTANTQEVIDLKGANYNAYWGLQEGKIRNANTQQVQEPLLMLHHELQLDNQFKLQSTVAYQFGKISKSRLGNNGLDNPSPTYYKSLPSYALQFEDYANAYLLREALQSNGQINWSNLYQVNATINETGYFLLDDVNEDKQFTFQTILNHKIATGLKLDFGLSWRAMKSENYALLQDDFNGGGLLDIDPFETGLIKENDLLHKGRIIQAGDRFSYNYQVDFSEVELFGQWSVNKRAFETSLSLQYNHTNYRRNGNYLNGKYPESSFGSSEKLAFNSWSTKANLLYKISGKHLIITNLGLLNRAPFLNNAFVNIRVSNKVSEQVQKEKIYTADLTYQYRAPKLRGRITGYYTLFKDAAENSFVFAEGLYGDNADFIAQSLTGINKQHLGVELGAVLDINAEFSLDFVAAVGQYSYANNPNLWIESNTFSNGEGNLGKAFMKNYKIGGTPQKAFSIGINYKNPAYWWLALNGNLLLDHYVHIAPLLRTENFYLGADGVPFVDAVTGKNISQSQVDDLLLQEKFAPLFLVNALGGKSWKFGEDYLGLFVSINNILGQVYKTGGFEQARKANYKELQADKALQTPLFGNKYWMQNGTTFFVVLSYRF